MANLSGRVNQSPSEVKRYVLDYTAQLASGESVNSINCTVSQTTVPPVTPAVVVTNVAIGPGGNQVVFYVSGGVDQNNYELDFDAVTTLAQTFEDVVAVKIRNKT